MSEPWESAEVPQAPQVVVGTAIQNLAAARLGRGFLPLAILFLAGVGETVAGGIAARGLGLAVGAPLSAGAMLAYGLRIVQRAFDKPRAPWMAVAGVASLVPPLWGLWVFGWLGLRGIAVGGGTGALVGAVAFTVVSLWFLRSWLRLLELQRLTDVMSLGLPGDQETGS